MPRLDWRNLRSGLGLAFLLAGVGWLLQAPRSEHVFFGYMVPILALGSFLGVLVHALGVAAMARVFGWRVTRTRRSGVWLAPLRGFAPVGGLQPDDGFEPLYIQPARSAEMTDEFVAIVLAGPAANLDAACLGFALAWALPGGVTAVVLALLALMQLGVAASGLDPRRRRAGQGRSNLRRILDYRSGAVDPHLRLAVASSLLEAGTPVTEFEPELIAMLDADSAREPFWPERELILATHWQAEGRHTRAWAALERLVARVPAATEPLSDLLALYRALGGALEGAEALLPAAAPGEPVGVLRVRAVIAHARGEAAAAAAALDAWGAAMPGYGDRDDLLLVEAIRSGGRLPPLDALNHPASSATGPEEGCVDQLAPS